MYRFCIARVTFTEIYKVINCILYVTLTFVLFQNHMLQETLDVQATAMILLPIPDWAQSVQQCMAAYSFIEVIDNVLVDQLFLNFGNYKYF